MGLKSVLLRTLVAASSAKTASFGVPNWRATVDEHGQYVFAVALRADAMDRASPPQSPTR
jgi:hypothetical protein